MKRIFSPLTAIFLVILGAAFSVEVRTATPYLFADEAVYHAMTLSLAYQGDLKYQQADLKYFYRDYPAGPRGIVLRRSSDGKGIFYAKPFLYPCAAAPFFRLFGLNGYLVLNGLAWWTILFLLYRLWGAGSGALLFAVTALLLSAFSPYIVWIHPEMFSAALVATALFLWRRSLDGSTYPESPEHRRKKKIGADVLSGVLWGTAVMLKPPLIILATAPLASFIKRRFLCRLGRSVAGFVVAVAVILSASYMWTGTVNPYAGHRKIFNAHYPLETEEASFDATGNEWSVETAGFYFQPAVFAWNLFYFWVGRFSGIAWYFFPCIAVLFFWCVCKDARGPDSGYLLAALALSVMLELIMIPTNYHGGGGALGNRYFVPFYPAVLFLIRRPPRSVGTAVTMCIAGILAGPFLLQPFASSYRPGEHARSGFYRLFPAEWTLVGSFPIFNPAYRRVRFPRCKGYFYFLDHGTWGAENGGFQVRGDSSAEFFVEAEGALHRFVFHLEAPPATVEGTVRCGSERRTFRLLPGASGIVELPADAGRRLIDIFGRERRVYRCVIQVSGGAIPSHLIAGKDSRFSGVRILPEAD